ncbi:MAG TPA: class I tRNA ligase family protein, partial [Patescibacteria group bacterium]|nr:class I tRNA ligase family protein [Patescibacteria group bacterium]
PANANGNLHAGHALVLTIEDIMTRYKRMRGFKTLWLPGADHAGFETQVVYEKKLEKEGKSRLSMPREELYNEILQFTLTNKTNMESQTRSLGASCDWSRETFTLDPNIVKTVYQTFKKLSDDNLLYRGKRMVSWCIKHQTSFSDLEVVDREQTDKLYYIEYGSFVVATVRPETIFGDVAIAVNPNDDRYKKYVGQEIEVKTPIGSMKLKVVADEHVDINFGTGALKITPAHDANDFALSQRHDLPAIEVIDQFGKLNEKTSKYQGLKREKAREEVVKDLESMGLLKKTEDYKHSVPTCYKCEQILEPRIMPQWFVRMKPLAERAISSITNEEITYIPEHYKKISLHWLEHIIDW